MPEMKSHCLSIVGVVQFKFFLAEFQESENKESNYLDISMQTDQISFCYETGD